MQSNAAIATTQHFDELETTYDASGNPSLVCPDCGAELDWLEEIPSMLGYGSETRLACSACGASLVENPLIGGYTLRRR